MIMFGIETKELKISEELNRKIEMICRFACVKPYILKIKENVQRNICLTDSKLSLDPTSC